MHTGDILVPVDFSACSLRALDFAISQISPGGELYLLHVIDDRFLNRLDELGFSTREAATESMRSQAERSLDQVIGDRQPSDATLNKMIVIGVPFVEILRIAKDLDFNLVVMGIRGGGSPIEELLFGGTADKVLRGARVPVVCVP